MDNGKFSIGFTDLAPAWVRPSGLHPNFACAELPGGKLIVYFCLEMEMFPKSNEHRGFAWALACCLFTRIEVLIYNAMLLH